MRLQAAIPQVPLTRLVVPAPLAARLEAAVAAGATEAATWRANAPDGTDAQFDGDAVASIGPAPSGAAERAELAELYVLARSRTAAGVARAEHLGDLHGDDVWEGALADIRRIHGADQAREAAGLLQVANQRVGRATKRAKADVGRLRPYELDPSFPVGIRKPPAGNASHPSGHASGAYASALLLAHFLPEQASELVGIADEMAYSRMYGGVHFASDVVEGARLASRIVADVLRAA